MRYDIHSVASTELVVNTELSLASSLLALRTAPNSRNSSTLPYHSDYIYDNHKAKSYLRECHAIA